MKDNAYEKLRHSLRTSGSFWLFCIKDLPIVAVFFSFVANTTFFFAAHRVDSRFVHGLVGTYEVSALVWN